MNIKIIFFVSSIFTLIIAGCSEITPPSYENPLDPEAGNFKGVPPSGFIIDSDSPRKLTLKWKDNSGYEKKYILERIKSFGQFEEMAELPPNSAEYTDSSVSIYDFYGYRLKMISSHGYISYSETVWAIYSPYINYIKSKNSGILKFQFSNDEKYKALSAGSGGIYIVRSSDNAELRQFSISSQVFSFTPDSRNLAAADEIKKIIGIWDITSGTMVRTITGFNNGFRSISFSPDGEYLAVADRNDLIKVFNFNTGSEVFSLKADNFLTKISFSNTSEYFIYSTNTKLHLLNTKDWNTKKTFVYPSYSYEQNIDFSANDKYLVFEDGNNISVYDIDQAAIISKIEGAKSFSIQKSGEIAAYTDSYGRLQIWQLENYKLKFPLKQTTYTGYAKVSLHVWENGNVDYLDDYRILTTWKFNNSWVRFVE